MVTSLTMYLVASAVTVAVQMQRATATSLRYDPVAILSTTESASSIYSGMGVDDEICKFKSHFDPTLPDLATISRTDVLHPDLLSNQSSPRGDVYRKVGINVVLSDLTEDLDEYTYVASKSVTSIVVSVTKTDRKTPSKTGKGNVKDEDIATNYATDSDNPMTTPNSGREINEKNHTERRLEELHIEHIVRLEKHFGVKMVTTLADLPTVGAVLKSPWAGPYWPAYEDSINAPLYKNRNPTSAKYALAFGLNVKNFMDAISEEAGIKIYSSNKPKCKKNKECKHLKTKSVCSIPIGHSSGFCIPKWWGICNAWASAAILEPEPICHVTYNNVKFSPLELKGLLSYIYNGAKLPAIFTGVRFNDNDDTDIKDEYGRSKNLAFRDINPGLVHIVFANIVGKLDQSFIIDSTAGKEVWNQPVRGFKVLEQTEMSLEEAAKTFYAREQYPWNANAKSIVFMKTRLTWIEETYADGPLVSTGKIDKYTTGHNIYYLLEMDDDGTIIGGEWLYHSNNKHPDFMWIPTRKPPADLVLPNGMSYADVSMLLKKSVACSHKQ